MLHKLHPDEWQSIPEVETVLYNALRRGRPRLDVMAMRLARSYFGHVLQSDGGSVTIQIASFASHALPCSPQPSSRRGIFWRPPLHQEPVGAAHPDGTCAPHVRQWNCCQLLHLACVAGIASQLSALTLGLQLCELCLVSAGVRMIRPTSGRGGSVS